VYKPVVKTGCALHFKLKGETFRFRIFMRQDSGEGRLFQVTLLFRSRYELLTDVNHEVSGFVYIHLVCGIVNQHINFNLGAKVGIKEL
jgi:hypothetical protein